MLTDKLNGNADVRLIIYSHPENGIDGSDYPRIRRMERALYKKLYECNGQTNIHYTRLDRQIYISFNDAMFQNIMREE